MEHESRPQPEAHTSRSEPESSEGEDIPVEQHQETDILTSLPSEGLVRTTRENRAWQPHGVSLGVMRRLAGEECIARYRRYQAEYRGNDHEDGDRGQS